MFTTATLLLLIGLVAVPVDTVYTLPEMTVTATRLEADVTEIGQRVERISAASIASTGSRSVADVLARNAAVYVRQYGPSGLASLSLRGTGASQTSILLDGRRIGDPQLGQLDLSLLPVDMLESVEVLHGSASAIHGSDGIGGAVNLRTIGGANGTAGSMRFGAGDFGEREMAARASFGSAGAGVTFVGRMQSAQNDYPYFSRALGREVRMQGAGREQSAIYASAQTAREYTRARMSFMVTSSQRGLPAGSGVTAYERQEDDALRLWADVRRAIGRGYVKAGGLIQRSDIRYQNDLLRVDDLGRTSMVSGEVEAGTRFGLWNVLAGTELGQTSASHPSIADIDPEQRLAVYAQAQGPLGRASAYPSLRIDRYLAQGPSGTETVRLALSPTLGINVPVSSWLRLRASAGRSFRMPTFNDRFWTPGGNPDLHPERGWTLDGAAIFNRGPHRADLTVFILDTRDQIVWSPVSADVWSPSNVARTVVRGLESSIRTATVLGAGHLDFRLSYRLADARDRSDSSSRTFNAPLRYRPRHVGNSELTWRTNDIEVSLGGAITGRTYTTDDRSQWLAAYAVASAGAAYSRDVGPARLTFSGRIENVLDSDYSVVENRPMPPRHIRFSVQIESSTR
jgi:vitamin B12 transporter